MDKELGIEHREGHLALDPAARKNRRRADAMRASDCLNFPDRLSVRRCFTPTRRNCFAVDQGDWQESLESRKFAYV